MIRRMKIDKDKSIAYLLGHLVVCCVGDVEQSRALVSIYLLDFKRKDQINVTLQFQ